jgi:hypothetical protein
MLTQFWLCLRIRTPNNVNHNEKIVAVNLSKSNCLMGSNVGSDPVFLSDSRERGPLAQVRNMLGVLKDHRSLCRLARQTFATSVGQAHRSLLFAISGVTLSSWRSKNHVSSYPISKLSALKFSPARATVLDSGYVYHAVVKDVSNDVWEVTHWLRRVLPNAIATASGCREIRSNT